MHDDRLTWESVLGPFDTRFLPGTRDGLHVLNEDIVGDPAQLLTALGIENTGSATLGHRPEITGGGDHAVEKHRDRTFARLRARIRGHLPGT